MSETTFTQADVQSMIDKALAAQQANHEAAMDALRSQVSGTVPASAVPEHAAGPGLKVAPTWSLREQELELARRERALLAE